jgi:glycosyltransferase involved in cell wall biosynthesis
MTRVVINGRFLAQRRTGVQRYAGETLRALDHVLAQRPEIGQRLSFELAIPAGAAIPALEHIRVVTLPFLQGHFWEQASLAWYARGAFLVNFSYSGPIFKRRQMITVHDAAPAAHPATFSRRYRALHHLLLGSLKRRAEVVMTVSEFSRRELGHHFGMAREVVVGHCGWEHARAASDSLATLAPFGIEPGRYVLAVGSLKPSKNFALLGRALRLLGDFPLPVAIAGARDAGVFQASEPVPGDVRWLGYVSDQALADLYRHATCFVLPSLYEGFGLPALEAMANGCPVLAARAGSIPEVCGDAACYFDPFNPASLARALREVTSDPALRDALRTKGARRLAGYTWRNNAEIVATQVLRHADQTEREFLGAVGMQRRV